MSYSCIICCSLYVCIYACVSSDDLAAYKNVEDWQSPLPGGWESAVSTGVVNYQTQWKSTGLRREATKDMYKNHKVIFIRIYLYMYTYSISIY